VCSLSTKYIKIILIWHTLDKTGARLLDVHMEIEITIRLQIASNKWCDLLVTYDITRV